MVVITDDLGYIKSHGRIVYKETTFVVWSLFRVSLLHYRYRYRYCCVDVVGICATKSGKRPGDANDGVATYRDGTGRMSFTGFIYMEMFYRVIEVILKDQNVSVCTSPDRSGISGSGTNQPKSIVRQKFPHIISYFWSTCSTSFSSFYPIQHILPCLLPPNTITKSP